MEEQPFNIPIDEPQKEFAKHLEPKENKRIIFSAPFGTGKTYFLKKFFDGRKTKEKVIHLFPVNYSVSSNEDVFELIKFDILLQLLEDESIELDDNSFSTFFIAQFFLLHNADKVVEWILNRFGKVGKAVNKHAQMIERVVKAYQKFEHEMQTNADKSTAVDFLFAIKNKQGNVYESDAITNLICGLIQQYEENYQKTVLIIDDLDRIDPEHIFRLLNVFAAHFDIGAPDTNKFGFDKVIFVCDINNIRNIFHAKYGTATDFTGYIDKFYSTDIFTFDNMDATITFVTEKVLSHLKQNSLQQSIKLEHIRNYSPFKQLFEYVLKRLVVAKAINYRGLQKISNFTLNFKEVKIGKNEVTNYNSIVVLMLNILKKLLGDYESVLNALSKAKDSQLLDNQLTYRFDNESISRLFIGNIIAALYCVENRNYNTDMTMSFPEFTPIYTITGTFKKYYLDYTFLIDLLDWKCEPEIDKKELAFKDMEFFIHLLNELRKRRILTD
ncbi:P-loop NTPase fold protein [Oscillatoria amoena NRMC-F 0135]|nr:P-loop NTPase fold protein [Oscillatoria amoena NRMC-F 0135]